MLKMHMAKLEYFLLKLLFPTYIYTMIVHEYLLHTRSYCVIMKTVFLTVLTVVSKNTNWKTLFYNSLTSDL